MVLGLGGVDRGGWTPRRHDQDTSTTNATLSTPRPHAISLTTYLLTWSLSGLPCRILS